MDEYKEKLKQQEAMVARETDYSEISSEENNYKE